MSLTATRDSILRLGRSRWWVTLTVCFSLLSVQCRAAGAGQPRPSGRHKVRLWVICTKSVFPSVNQNDTIGAGTVWMRSMAVRRGFDADIRFEILDDVAAVRSRVLAGTVDFLLSDPVEFLDVHRTGVIKPVVSISHRRDTALYRYLLIAPAAGKSTLAELRGSSIVYYARSGARLPQTWIEGLLEERRLGSADRFFSSSGTSPRSAGACLPVFFGKSGACVVDSISWDMMREMNPQLSSRLRVLESSPEVLEAIGSLHDHLRDGRDDLIQALGQLDQEPEGRQFLLMFRTARLVPIALRDFDGVKEIVRKVRGTASGVGPGEAGQ